PEIEISKESENIHGISNQDVENLPNFKSVAKEIAKFIEGCDLAGYNSLKFDIPMLVEEFLRAEVDIDLRKHNFVDVQVIFMKKEPRTLTAALKFYCDKVLEDAHSASSDTIATYEVLLGQLKMYEDLPNDIEKLSEFSSFSNFADYAGRLVYDDNKEIRVNFGKHKGLKLVDVFKKDPSYYSWIQNGDFPLFTKKILTEEYLKFKTEQN
ncbi:MAG: 3'-5' exonuclease, partial [Bacteroidales bacterium]|nr:3'-5' exonuclease [Bacteroidales bacterium]